jgi:hypothetical protein
MKRCVCVAVTGDGLALVAVTVYVTLSKKVAGVPMPKNIALIVTEPAGAIEAIVPDFVVGGKIINPPEADIVQLILYSVAVPTFLIIALIPIPNPLGTVIVRFCCADTADTGKTRVSNISITSTIPAFITFFFFILLFPPPNYGFNAICYPVTGFKCLEKIKIRVKALTRF